MWISEQKNMGSYKNNNQPNNNNQATLYGLYILNSKLREATSRKAEPN